jgi:hypothetical protein
VGSEPRCGCGWWLVKARKGNKQTNFGSKQTRTREINNRNKQTRTREINNRNKATFNGMVEAVKINGIFRWRELRPRCRHSQSVEAMMGIFRKWCLW